MGPLEKQPVLLTVEPSLQLQDPDFLNSFGIVQDYGDFWRYTEYIFALQKGHKPTGTEDEGMV